MPARGGEWQVASSGRLRDTRGRYISPDRQARIARQEAFLAEADTEFLVQIEEGAGDAVADRAGARGHSATVDRGDDVELLQSLGGHERLADDHLQGLVAPEELVEALIIEGKSALAGAEVNPGHRGLALAGADVFCDCCCQDEPLLLHADRLGALSRMAMGAPGINLEFGEHGVPELRLREHAADGFFDRPHGLLRHHVLGGRLGETPHVSGVPPVELAFELAPGQRHFGRVDDDHVVAGVEEGGEGGLVLAREQVSGPGGEAADDDIVAVEQKPVALDVF